MTKTDLPLNYIFQKYHKHLVIYGKKKFPVTKAKALEIIMIVLVTLGIGTTLWVLEKLHPMAVRQWKVTLIIAAIFLGMILYIYIVFMAGVKRYWMAYRAVQAFTDPRKPVVYLRAFHADDVVERQETPDSPESRMLVALGRLHKWLTGSPNPMTRYSLEEDIAPYFRRLGPFLSIGRPTEFAQMIGSTRIYVEDNYWQSVVLDLLATAEFVVVRADISSGLSWKIEQVFRKMSAERIVLLLADKYGNPYAEEQYVTLLSVLPQDVCVMLPNTLGNIWYIYFKPGEIPCTVSRENGISDIRGATAALLRQISGCQGIVTTKDNLAPDDDLDVLAMVAAAIVIVGIMVVLLDVLRITLM